MVFAVVRRSSSIGHFWVVHLFYIVLIQINEYVNSLFYAPPACTGYLQTVGTVTRKRKLIRFWKVYIYSCIYKTLIIAATAEWSCSDSSSAFCPVTLCSVMLIYLWLEWCLHAGKRELPINLNTLVHIGTI